MIAKIELIREKMEQMVGYSSKVAEDLYCEDEFIYWQRVVEYFNKLITYKPGLAEKMTEDELVEIPEQERIDVEKTFDKISKETHKNG